MSSPPQAYYIFRERWRRERGDLPVFGLPLLQLYEAWVSVSLELGTCGCEGGRLLEEGIGGCRGGFSDEEGGCVISESEI